MRLREFLQRTKRSEIGNSTFQTGLSVLEDSKQTTYRNGKSADNRLTEQQLLYISEYYLAAR
ncbi:hypothetical protein HGB47_20540 [Leptospira yasudae]|uniref:hypothetical protein n=1 Tax=Leptospira TaxID=171 RepID=UPI001C4FD647|nr:MULTISPECIES: hypothetical protein [Leptospira]MBW0435998.1 hypothetical protein [Leptospira yasudae]MCG6167786.1 hypothetical protein [Leptospira sanjuanensis]MCG6193203.1 hypothetical protein [Leptospira sanjuanensis]